MTKTLKGKISFLYLCLVLLIALVGATSVVNLYELTGAIDGLMINNYKSINALTNMMESIERQDSAILIYINVDRQKGIDLFSEHNNHFLKWFNIAYNNITEPGEKELAESLYSKYSSYTKLFSELQEIRNSRGEEKSAEFYNSKIMSEFVSTKNEIKEMLSMNEKAMFNRKEKASLNARNSMYLVLILSTLAVIGGFLASRFFTDRFLRPIYSLTQTVKRVRDGDLNQQTDIISYDEIGELTREFNNMTARLHQYEQSAYGKLMAEKNKSLAIVKSISDPMVVLDRNYKIILINDACEKFFGLKEERVLNKHFLEAIRNGEVFDHISSVFESGGEHKDKITFLQADGEDFYFNVVVTPIKDVNTLTVGLIVVFQNVTQLKQLERIKTDFVSTISHELKTPLTSIMMGTSLLNDESLGPVSAKQKETIEAINEDTERLSALVNDLLELSRIESGKALFNIKPCSVIGIVENSIKPLYERAEQKEINLYFEADDDLPKVTVDAEKITWVVNNLITNALKYTNAGDEICVSAYVQKGKMHISVRDTGEGIPEEFLEKIFDKFVQVKGQDLEVRGTGLGLAIAKEIVEAHGGTIRCESKLDEGSNFIFTLPLSEGGIE